MDIQASDAAQNTQSSAPVTGNKRPAPDEPLDDPQEQEIGHASSGGGIDSNSNGNGNGTDNGNNRDSSAIEQSGYTTEHQSRGRKSRRTTPTSEAKHRQEHQPERGLEAEQEPEAEPKPGKLFEPRQGPNPEETPDPQPEAEPEVEPKPKPQSTCGVCKANPPKYKCPRCYLPYCSVACNKLHRETHPPDPDPKPQAPRGVVSQPSTLTSSSISSSTTAASSSSSSLPSTTHDPHHVVVAAADPTNPFRALDSSEALRALFKKYPNLPAQLLEIHAATQPPPRGETAPDKMIPASLLQGVPLSTIQNNLNNSNNRNNRNASYGRKSNGGRKDSPWTHDVGIKNGKAALRRARKDAGEAGEAIREYVELILHVMGEQGRQSGGNDAASSYLQQQAAREDTKLIQQLMAEEQRKR